MITECSVLAKQKIVDIWSFDLSVGDGGFYGSVKYYFGANQLRRSILSSPEEETKFRFMMRLVKKSRPIKLAVEIGTFKGTGTAILSHYTEKVVTIDKCNYIDKYAFWLEYRIYDKIKSYLIDNDEDKVKLLSNLDFDFAFIDGNHTEAGVRTDFELTKKCGRVLFHDYYEMGSEMDNGSAGLQGIVPVVDELPKKELIINRPFAYWEKSN